MKFRVVLLINFVFLVYFGFGQKKPNILWIMTEDIGCDMACYGTKGVHHAPSWINLQKKVLFTLGPTPLHRSVALVGPAL